MMNKDEAVQKLATAGRLSIAHAEDLYDSFFEKPVVPQYVADWYEENKEDYDYELWDYFTSFNDQEDNDFKKWIRKEGTEPIITLVNMHQFGYEVEEKTKYRVRVKAITDGMNFLKRDKDENAWYFGDYSVIGVLSHTRKELENANFAWVFDCEGIEIEEVDDGDD